MNNFNQKIKNTTIQSLTIQQIIFGMEEAYKVVQCRNACHANYFPPSTTIGQLLQKMQKQSHCESNKSYSISYDGKRINKQDYQLTLSQIVKLNPLDIEIDKKIPIPPVFYLFDYNPTPDKLCRKSEKTYKELKRHYDKNIEKKECQNQQGSNGLTVCQHRNLCLLTSSILTTLKKKQFYKQQMQQIAKEILFKTKHTSREDKQLKKQTNYVEAFLWKIQKTNDRSGFYNFFQRLFSCLGSVSEQVSSVISQVMKRFTIQLPLQLIQNITEEYNYTDFDLRFATEVLSVYRKYGIQNGFELQYIDYKQKQLNFGIVKKKIHKKAKIGIIGDFGTGLKDSKNLLQHMILDQKVDIILHLGDVYYSGTPQQYKLHITQPLNQFRIKANKHVLYYTVPGNHDYYSWGPPFFTFINEINNKIENNNEINNDDVKQSASYFCLRTQDQSEDGWQFLGIDTAYHDSNPISQLNPLQLGPRIRERQVEWHKDKIQNFKGSTILLSHHQLFSIHQKINGRFSSYRHYQFLNPLLSTQLFQYFPFISSWFWGHEHAFMLYAPEIMGINKCRLLGNSAFHVIQEYSKPYQRVNSEVYIPFIEPDQKYKQKYLPYNRDRSKNSKFYNLTYALIDMNQASQQGLPIKYFCCPSFSQRYPADQFKPYQIKFQYLESKKKIQKKYKTIQNQSIIYIKVQLGLLLTYKSPSKGNFVECQIVGRPFVIQLDNTNQNDKKDILTNSRVHLKIKGQSQYIANKNNEVFFSQNKSDDTLWKIKKKKLMKDQTDQIRYRDTIQFYSSDQSNEMIWIMDDPPRLGSKKNDETQTLFMFLEQSVIKETQPK